MADSEKVETAIEKAIITAQPARKICTGTPTAARKPSWLSQAAGAQGACGTISPPSTP